jgi:ubiquinone/menaquinone biosynthesis C-methylase UbiE
MLPRVLEPEVMDSAEDAHEYDAMDHAVVNDVFVDDLLAAIGRWSPPHAMWKAPALEHLRILDLGAGTAQILIKLVQRAPNFEVVAVDAAASMLDVARTNITAVNLDDRIDLFLADAKELPFDSYSFSVVISNSIVHHIPEPRGVIAEAVRVTASGGLLFHRDLARPESEVALQRIVDTYAAGANDYQRKLFADSLHAALTLEEMRGLVGTLGFAPETVTMTSDRHWTWSAKKM